MPFIPLTGRALEYEWRGESAPGKPTPVFLHEGLGSIEQWRDFPLRVASATGCAALVYSRYGYGQSDVLQEPRPPSFMHDEALRSLPELLSSLNIPAPVLLGHSDGASIALIHAGAGHAVRGLVLEAPLSSSRNTASRASAKRDGRSRPPTFASASASTIATRRGRSAAGTTCGFLPPFATGTSRSSFRACAARCSRSRGRTTSTAPRRSSTRSRGR